MSIKESNNIRSFTQQEIDNTLMQTRKLNSKGNLWSHNI